MTEKIHIKQLRSVVGQVESLPAASSTMLHKAYQYMGATNNTYQHGYIYECKKGGVFTPDIISCSVNDLKAYIQSETPYYGGVVKLTMTKKTDGLSKLWEMTAKDINNNIVPTYNSLFMIQKTQEDWENVGFTFGNNIAVDTVVSVAFEGPYVWERMDVQPNNDAEVTELQADVAEIQSVIPTQASASNQLADKNYVQSSLDAVSAHITDTNNPHSVTKAQIGLGNCDNTADLDKPISTATQTALDTKATPADITSAISTHNADSSAHSSIISPIQEVIPTAATSTNQLADKNFVNSSIATSTATFRGTYNSLAELEAQTADENDYGFVVSTDAAGNTVYNRYKYTTATTPASWVFEYALNNSSFTATQWGAINSGATTTNIGQIATNATNISNHIADTSNPHSVTKAQVGLGNVDNTSDLAKPISTATQTALNTKANSADLATVATSGSYNDLSDKPTIPTVNDATITVTQNGVSVGSFTLNQSSGDTIELTNTTYSVMTGASAGDAGTSGLVPAPAAGDQAKFLRGDGTWTNPTATTAWGNITGTLSDQTDLQNALDAKQEVLTAGDCISISSNTISVSNIDCGTLS